MLGVAPPTPLMEFLEALRLVINSLVSVVNNVAELIVQYPVFVLFLGVFFLGAAIGIFRRIINVR